MPLGKSAGSRSDNMRRFRTLVAESKIFEPFREVLCKLLAAHPALEYLVDGQLTDGIAHVRTCDCEHGGRACDPTLEGGHPGQSIKCHAMFIEISMPLIRMKRHAAESWSGLSDQRAQTFLDLMEYGRPEAIALLIHAYFSPYWLSKETEYGQLFKCAGVDARAFLVVCSDLEFQCGTFTALRNLGRWWEDTKLESSSKRGDVIDTMKAFGKLENAKYEPVRSLRFDEIDGESACSWHNMAITSIVGVLNVIQNLDSWVSARSTACDEKLLEKIKETYWSLFEKATYFILRNPRVWCEKWVDRMMWPFFLRASRSKFFATTLLSAPGGETEGTLSYMTPQDAKMIASLTGDIAALACIDTMSARSIRDMQVEPSDLEEYLRALACWVILDPENRADDCEKIIQWRILGLKMMAERDEDFVNPVRDLLEVVEKLCPTVGARMREEVAPLLPREFIQGEVEKWDAKMHRALGVIAMPRSKDESFANLHMAIEVEREIVRRARRIDAQAAAVGFFTNGRGEVIRQKGFALVPESHMLESDPTLSVNRLNGPLRSFALAPRGYFSDVRTIGNSTFEDGDDAVGNVVRATHDLLCLTSRYNVRSLEWLRCMALKTPSGIAVPESARTISPLAAFLMPRDFHFHVLMPLIEELLPRVSFDVGAFSDGCFAAMGLENGAGRLEVAKTFTSICQDYYLFAASKHP